MRLLLYNIRYGLGLGSALHWPLPGVGYLLGNRTNLPAHHRLHQSRRIPTSSASSKSTRARSGRAASIKPTSIARALGHYSVYQCKYGAGSLNHRLPILRKQGNAFLAAPRVHGERFHYFEKGIKRLIIELELEECAIFLVHLSLKFRHRHTQLQHLHDLVMASRKPVIVAGRLQYVLGRARDLSVHEGLQAAQREYATACRRIRAGRPRKELDFVLYGDGYA